MINIDTIKPLNLSSLKTSVEKLEITQEKRVNQVIQSIMEGARIEMDRQLGDSFRLDFIIEKDLIKFPGETFIYPADVVKQAQSYLKATFSRLGIEYYESEIEEETKCYLFYQLDTQQTESARHALKLSVKDFNSTFSEQEKQ